MILLRSLESVRKPKQCKNYVIVNKSTIHNYYTIGMNASEQITCTISSIDMVFVINLSHSMMNVVREFIFHKECKKKDVYKILGL